MVHPPAVNALVSDNTPPSARLRLALWAGVAYFCCMAIAHFFGLKYPLVFVYYDVPFHAYQDKIIAFAVIAYVCLFANAAVHRSGVPAAIVALGVTVLGLSAVNMSDSLRSLLDGRSTLTYWMQTGLIASYFVLLLGLHTAERSSRDPTGMTRRSSPDIR
jgi:hypothetical protein